MFLAKKLNTCSLRVGNTCTNKIKITILLYYRILPDIEGLMED